MNKYVLTGRERELNRDQIREKAKVVTRAKVIGKRSISTPQPGCLNTLAHAQPRAWPGSSHLGKMPKFPRMAGWPPGAMPAKNIFRRGRCPHILYTLEKSCFNRKIKYFYVFGLGVESRYILYAPHCMTSADTMHK